MSSRSPFRSASDRAFFSEYLPSRWFASGVNATAVLALTATIAIAAPIPRTQCLTLPDMIASIHEYFGGRLAAYMPNACDRRHTSSKKKPDKRYAVHALHGRSAITHMGPPERRD